MSKLCRRLEPEAQMKTKRGDRADRIAAKLVRVRRTRSNFSGTEFHFEIAGWHFKTTHSRELMQTYRDIYLGDLAAALRKAFKEVR